MGRSVSKSLSSLSFGLERKVKCYNGSCSTGSCQGCQQVYYTYTLSFRKDRSRVNWLSVLKMKQRGSVKVVQDENEDTSVRDEVFQVSELVEPYRVAPSIELEEKSNFHVSDDSLVDVDVEELNVVLSSSGQANVDEEDDIHIEDCDEGDDYSINNEEKDNSE